MKSTHSAAVITVAIAATLGVAYFASTPRDISSEASPPAAPTVETAPSRAPNTGDHHTRDLTAMPATEAGKRRTALDITGCKTLLDYRVYIPDLKTAPDEVSRNSEGNRVCKWTLGEIQVVVVDDSEGLVDNVSVLFDIKDKLQAVTGLGLVLLIADAHSKIAVNADSMMRWVIAHAGEEGQSERFGMANIKINGVHRTGAKHYVLVRIT